MKSFSNSHRTTRGVLSKKEMDLFTDYIKGEIPYDTISETLDEIESDYLRAFKARKWMVDMFYHFRGKLASEDEKDRFLELSQKMVQRFGPEFFKRSTIGNIHPNEDTIEQELLDYTTSDPNEPHYHPFLSIYEEHRDELTNPILPMTKSSNKEGGYSTDDITSALLITKGDHNAAAQLIINRMKT